MDASSYEGRILNPGHALEAGWFLLDYARFIGDAQLKAKALEIIDASFAAGWDGPIDAQVREGGGRAGGPAAGRTQREGGARWRPASTGGDTATPTTHCSRITLAAPLFLRAGNAGPPGRVRCG